MDLTISVMKTVLTAPKAFRRDSQDVGSWPVLEPGPSDLHAFHSCMRCPTIWYLALPLSCPVSPSKPRTLQAALPVRSRLDTEVRCRSCETPGRTQSTPEVPGSE